MHTTWSGAATSGMDLAQDFDFTKSYIIKPPKEADLYSNVNNRRTTRLYIDSRDRNLSFDQSPASYTITLDEDIPDVVMVELVDVRIPFVSQLVDATRNRLKIRIGSTTHDVIVPSGNYTESAMASLLQSIISTATGTGFQVLYDGATDKFTLSATTPFVLLNNGGVKPYGPQYTDVRRAQDGSRQEVRSGQSSSSYPDKSLGRILGFGPVDYASSSVSPGVHTLTAPFSKDFTNSEPIYMFLEAITVNTSINDKVNKSFAILYRDGDTCRCITSDSMFRKSFIPPLAKLSRIRVCFKDYFGNTVDFQNREHSFQLLITSLRQNRNYQSFMTAGAPP